MTVTAEKIQQIDAKIKDIGAKQKSISTENEEDISHINPTAVDVRVVIEMMQELKTEIVNAPAMEDKKMQLLERRMHICEKKEQVMINRIIGN